MKKYLGLFVILIFRTVKTTPVGFEKMYTRAVLTYLLVVGLNNAFIFKKFYWVFWALVIAGERISSLYTQRNEQLDNVDLEDISSASISQESISGTVGHIE